jgi:ATP-binding cassette, subfamily B, bacterial
LRVLGLWEWACGLPDGLQSRIGIGGTGLSAGEAQLVAFARVFLRDPGLVILDEATSRLDPATERLVERAVGNLLEGRTAILIAHRLTTVRKADRILIIENGSIVEEGERERLASEPTSRFSRLLRTGEQEVLA